MTRILIIGGPRCGKTTYARDLSMRTGVDTEHYDWLIDRYDWSEISDMIAEGLSDKGDWIREGVAAVRGLRKWLKRNDGIPPFKIVVLNTPRIPMTPEQRRMHTGTTTIIDEVMAEVDRRRNSV